MDALSAWLTRFARLPYEWGHRDCMLFMADWVAHVTGTDPAADLRDSYGNPEVCPVGRGYRNDPLPVVARAFAGLAPTTDPVRGDVALVQFHGQRFLTGAICLGGGGWAAKLPPAGVLTFKGRCEFRHGWRVAHAS